MRINIEGYVAFVYFDDVNEEVTQADLEKLSLKAASRNVMVINMFGSVDRNGFKKLISAIPSSVEYLKASKTLFDYGAFADLPPTVMHINIIPPSGLEHHAMKTTALEQGVRHNRGYSNLSAELVAEKFRTLPKTVSSLDLTTDDVATRSDDELRVIFGALPNKGRLTLYGYLLNYIAFPDPLTQKTPAELERLSALLYKELGFSEITLHDCPLSNEKLNALNYYMPNGDNANDVVLAKKSVTSNRSSFYGASIQGGQGVSPVTAASAVCQNTALPSTAVDSNSFTNNTGNVATI